MWRLKCLVFEDSNVKSAKLCFHIDSAKLCKVLLLFNCPLTYQNWNMRTFLIWHLIKSLCGLWILPRIIFGFTCMKKCWQVAIWFLTKLASLNCSGLFYLFINASFSLQTLKKKILRSYFKLSFSVNLPEAIKRKFFFLTPAFSFSLWWLAGWWLWFLLALQEQ